MDRHRAQAARPTADERSSEDPDSAEAASADELIVGQYADRPQLRPVLDAVLATLSALGPVTVQARKTVVSLVTPRRTFAVIQATTRNRVDLGLRLDHECPGGRLLAARDLGAATVRIALTRREDVDADVLGWLRRAYQENAAPPAPRRPARRPAPKLGTLTVVIEAVSLPGLSWPADTAGERHNVHIALSAKSTERPALAVPGKPWLATEPVPGDAPSARWEAPVTVRRDADGFDFSGRCARGPHRPAPISRLGRRAQRRHAAADPRQQARAPPSRSPARRGSHAPRAPARRPDPADRHPRPHLVGGTGRFGTWVVHRVLGSTIAS